MNEDEIARAYLRALKVLPKPGEWQYHQCTGAKPWFPSEQGVDKGQVLEVFVAPQNSGGVLADIILDSKSMTASNFLVHNGVSFYGALATSMWFPMNFNWAIPDNATTPTVLADHLFCTSTQGWILTSGERLNTAGLVRYRRRFDLE